MARDAAHAVGATTSGSGDTYWSRWPGMYFAGDGAKKDEDGEASGCSAASTT
ncbi:MAG: hypothetical protein R2734_04345 [Nocardioides sp.]